MRRNGVECAAFTHQSHISSAGADGPLRTHPCTAHATARGTGLRASFERWTSPILCLLAAVAAPQAAGTFRSAAGGCGSRATSLGQQKSPASRGRRPPARPLGVLWVVWADGRAHPTYAELCASRHARAEGVRHVVAAVSFMPHRAIWLSSAASASTCMPLQTPWSFISVPGVIG